MKILFKKGLSLLLATMMVLSCMSGLVFAAGNPVFTFTADKNIVDASKANENEGITIKLQNTNKKGISGCVFYIYCDPTVFEVSEEVLDSEYNVIRPASIIPFAGYEGTVAIGEIKNLVSLGQYYGESGKDGYSVVWAKGGDMGKEDFLSIKLYVKEDAINGTYPISFGSFTDALGNKGGEKFTADFAGNVTVEVKNGVDASAMIPTVNFVEDADGGEYTYSTTKPTPDALKVTASADKTDSFSYQWYKNTTNSTSGGTAVGENSATYSPILPGIRTTDYYYCVVTNTYNGREFKGTSAVAAVSYVPAPLPEITLTTPVTYTGSEVNPNAFIGSLSASTDFEWDGTTKAIEPGDYTISAEGKGNYTGTQSKPWTIGKVTLIVGTPSVKNTKTYNGSVAAEVTDHAVTGTVGSHTVENAVEVTAAYDDANVGTDKNVTVTYKIKDAYQKYYQFGDGKTEIVKTTTADITPVLVTKPAASRTEIYKGSAYTVAAENEGYTIEGTNSVTNACETETPYTVTLKLKDNYAWTDNSTDDYVVALIINKFDLADKEITWVPAEQNVVVGVGTLTDPVAKIGDMVVTGTVKYVFDTATTKADVEALLKDKSANTSHTVTVSIIGDDKNFINTSAEGTITAKMVDIVFTDNTVGGSFAANTSATYGDAWSSIMTKYAPNYTATLNDAEVKGGKYYLSVDGVKYEKLSEIASELPDAGDHIVNVVFTHDGKDYNVLPAAVTVAVDQKLLTDAMVKVPESVDYTGAALTPATVTDKVNGKELISTDDYEIKYSNNIAAGDATVTVTPKSTGNYQGSAIVKNFKIKPSVLAITGAAYEKIYDGTTAVTFADVGVTFNKTVAPSVYSVTAAALESEDAGTCKLSITVKLNDPNCSFSADPADKTATFDGTGVINPLKLTDVTADVAAATYTGSALKPAVTLKSTQLVTGDNASDILFDTDYTDNINAGESTAKATIYSKKGGNYTFDTFVKSFSIGKATLTEDNFKGITISKTYDGETLDVGDIKGNVVLNGKAVTGTWTLEPATSGADITSAKSSVPVKVTFENSNINKSSAVEINAVINPATPKIVGSEVTDEGDVVIPDDAKTLADILDGTKNFEPDGEVTWYITKNGTKKAVAATTKMEAVDGDLSWEFKVDDSGNYKTLSGKAVVSDEDSDDFPFWLLGSLLTPPTSFDDVPHNAWFKKAVDYVVSKGLFKGVTNDEFNPNGGMTRAMLVTVLWRLDGSQKAYYETSFKDVVPGAWYADAVAWANANGLVLGYDANTFGTNDLITRQQMATILFRYAQSRNLNTTYRANMSGYTDAGSVSGYAYDAMSWAVDCGLITGMTETTLVPGGTATRAQVATILMRFVQWFGL